MGRLQSTHLGPENHVGGPESSISESGRLEVNTLPKAPPDSPPGNAAHKRVMSDTMRTHAHEGEVTRPRALAAHTRLGGLAMGRT